MITAEDINYSEKLYENLTVQDIHSLTEGSILIWSCGSGTGGNRNNGTYYVLLDDGKGYHKYLEADIRGATTNQAILAGLTAAVNLIKKPSTLHVIAPCSLGFKQGFRGKGTNGEMVQQFLELVKEKGHSLSFSIADVNVVKGWIGKQAGKEFLPRNDKTKRLAYVECIDRVVELLEDEGVDKGVIEKVKMIKPSTDVKVHEPGESSEELLARVDRLQRAIEMFRN